MERQNPSIFNDIVGPTMVGPSSSHTCAPARIGFTARQLLNGKLKKAVIEFAKEGAYTDMYKGQHSDMGFVAGLLGFRPEDPRLRDSFNLAKQAGIDIKFVISDFKPIVPNLAKITLFSDSGEEVKVDTDSTGGGTFKILAIDGFETAIVGDCYELIVYADTADEQSIVKMKADVASLFDSYEGASTSSVNGKTLMNFHLRKEIAKEKINEIKKTEHVSDVKVIEPILVVASNRNTKMPFQSAAELLELAEKDNKQLWELAIDYECARSGWTPKQVMDYMQYVVETMERGAQEALKGDIDMNGIIKPTAGKIDKTCKEGKTLIDMGVLDVAVPWGMAVMEYSCAMGVVLCAPTGGSAGVFPGAIIGTAHKLGLSMEEKVKTMLTVAVTGIVMSKDCNYSAELYGCQVEPGAASAMAASGLVYVMGGTVKQSMDAASCGIQNILGTICDPVAGLVQVPCISRNVIAIANAVTSANIVMGGYDPLIPLDESAETMFRVGKQLPSELRCTCKGGLCTTATGLKLAKEQDERDNARYEALK